MAGCEANGIVRRADDLGLLVQLHADVVEVSGGLERGVAEAQEGLECRRVAALLHQPTWGTLQKQVIRVSKEQIHSLHIPGQKSMPRANGTAGMNAERSCRHQAIVPVFSTIMFAAKPRKIPNAV